MLKQQTFQALGNRHSWTAMVHQAEAAQLVNKTATTRLRLKSRAVGLMAALLLAGTAALIGLDYPLMRDEM